LRNYTDLTLGEIAKEVGVFGEMTAAAAFKSNKRVVERRNADENFNRLIS